MVEHIAVLGSGIVGSCIALRLVRAGYQVTVIDPFEAGSPESASFGNGAWISPASIIPMSGPGLWKKIPGYLLDNEGPLTIRWRYLPQLMPWLLRFMLAGRTADKVRSTAKSLCLLLADAPRLHRELAESVGSPDLIVQRGLLYAFANKAARESEALSWSIRQENGVAMQELDGKAMRDLVPDLSEAYDYGILVKDGAHCMDPGLYTRTLFDAACTNGAKVLRAKALGFEWNANNRLSAILTDQGPLPCDTAVIAAGVRSRALALAVGDRIPLESERGYHVTFTGSPVRPSVPVMPQDGRMANTAVSDGFRCSGQVELASVDAPPRWKRADILQSHAERSYPALAAASRTGTTRWMGHRPSTPDGLPVIGRSRRSADVFYAFGHGHTGLSGSAATAELLSGLIAGAPMAVEKLRAFSPDRF